MLEALLDVPIADTCDFGCGWAELCGFLGPGRLIVLSDFCGVIWASNGCYRKVAGSLGFVIWSQPRLMYFTGLA